jgi:hypothetical protein
MPQRASRSKLLLMHQGTASPTFLEHGASNAIFAKIFDNKRRDEEIWESAFPLDLDAAIHPLANYHDDGQSFCEGLVNREVRVSRVRVCS